MSYKIFIGVDVSKNWLDLAVVTMREKAVVVQLHCDNTMKALSAVKKDLSKYGIVLNKSCIVALEHTGIYSRALLNFLIRQKCSICVESGLQIKKSFGIQRGKSDVIDCRRIAEYALRNQDKLRIWQHPRDAIYKLKDLLNLRKKLMKMRHSITVPLQELKPFYTPRQFKNLTLLSKDVLDGLQKSFRLVEKELKSLVQSDKLIRHQVELLSSINGIADITALTFIYFTHEFTKISKAGQLSSYAGVAPFEYSSGSSVKGKPHVQRLANKELKTLLHMAALRTITKKGEHRAYYLRKVKEGKPKMSVINAVRNKIVKRIAAVINRGTPYVSSRKYATMRKKLASGASTG